MSLKKRLISGATALALIGSTSFALDISTDGTGDYLIAPAYVAVGGWKTDIKVVNTNTTHAVVAKVVIREGARSQEVLDFPIYLTPGDVWKGTIYQENGVVKIKSDDDSLMLGMNPAGQVQCTSVGVIKPKQVGLETALNVLPDSKLYKGYVEVFGLAAYDAKEIAKQFGSSWSVGCNLNKDWLFTVARDFGNPDNLNSMLVTPVDVDNSTLIGEQVIVNEIGASDADMRFMKLNMLALKDVATTPKLEGVIAADTKFPTVADISETDYRRLMLKKHVYVLYDGDGSEVAPFQTIFTFPYMKNVQVGAVEDYTISSSKIVFRDYEEHANACGVPAGLCNSTPCSPNVDPNSGKVVDPLEDLSGSEVPGCPTITYSDEVSVVVGGTSGEAKQLADQYAYKVGGYIDIDLSDLQGLPVIPTTMHARKVGNIYLNNHLYNQYKK